MNFELIVFFLALGLVAIIIILFELKLLYNKGDEKD